MTMLDSDMQAEAELSEDERMDLKVLRLFREYGSDVIRLKVGTNLRHELMKTLMKTPAAHIQPRETARFYASIQRLVESGLIEKKLLSDDEGLGCVDYVQYRLIG